jgi:hypothetical protein
MFVAVLATCTVSPVFGQEPAKGGEPVGPPAGAPVAPAADPCGPAMITIPVVECVPETYKVKQIVYKKVCKQETYTAYRCETFPVTKTRQVCTYVKKAVYKDVCKTVVEKVPCWEEKTVMKPCYSYQNVTEMRSKKVDKGYWVNEEVPAHFKNFCNRLGSFGHHKNDCCDPCASSCNSCPAPATRCVKKWCPCWVTECCPVTVCKKVCTMKAECVKVCTYKCVTKTVTCKVCEYVCEPCYKTETYCCHETRQVPVTCTRNVVSCVPCEEWVTCTRLVAKTTYRQVPACNTSCNSCCETSNNCCGNGGGHKLRGLFANRGHGHKNDCCASSSSCCGGGH